MRIGLNALVLALGAVGAFCMPAAAQESAQWPARTIRVITPVAPGGSLDIVARLVLAQISRELNREIIVENRAGADLQIGVVAAARSAPDGYTWLVGSIPMTTNPVLRKVPYDPIKDFAPVGEMGSSAYLAVVPTALGTKTLKDFVELARTKPGELNYANSAVASLVQMNTALFEAAAGIRMAGILYNGQAPGMIDVAANRVQFMIVSAGAAAPFIDSGKVIPVAALGEERLGMYPNVPTMGELGYRGVNVESWVGLLMPAGTPPGIVAKANAALNAALRDPETRAKLVRAGVTPAKPQPPEAFGQRMRDEMARWPKVFELARIKPEN